MKIKKKIIFNNHYVKYNIIPIINYDGNKVRLNTTASIYAYIYLISTGKYLISLLNMIFEYINMYLMIVIYNILLLIILVDVPANIFKITITLKTIDYNFK